MMTTNTTCRMCGSKELKRFLDLYDQPLANSFVTPEQFPTEPTFPLQVFFCETCSLAQLVHVVDKEVLFSDYVYFSSGMPTLSNHFLKYAEDVIKRFLKPGQLVVEIASNDGILLKHFKEKGFRVLGIDPAENIVPIAEANGVRTLPHFFSESLATSIVNDEGHAHAILANNVVAHINDHQDLARGIKTLLAPDGVFVFEAPYLIDMFDNLSFDTIYHEHLSFLAVRPVVALFARHHLEVFHVEVHPVQGFSLRVFVGHPGAHEVNPSVAQYQEEEKKRGLDVFATYELLAERVHENKEKLTQLLAQLKSTGARIAAYGAPAKGNTLLNFFNIGADVLEFAVDDLPTKQHKYTPGMHIPVLSRAEARERDPDYYLLLAWNYKDAILAKEQAFINGGGKFIYPIGEPRVL